jgi:hypothetical protein
MMTIAANHPDLVPSTNLYTAMVSTPSLKSWAYPTSSLLGSIVEMAMRFGERPPVFSKPQTGYTPQQPATSTSTGGQSTTFNPMLQHQQQMYGQNPAARPHPTQPVGVDQSMLQHPLYAAFASASGAGNSGQPHYQHGQPPSTPGFPYNPHQPAAHPIDVGPTPEEKQRVLQREFEASFSKAATTALVLRAQSAAEAFHRQASSEVERLERLKFALQEKNAEYQMGVSTVFVEAEMLSTYSPKTLS